MKDSEIRENQHRCRDPIGVPPQHKLLQRADRRLAILHDVEDHLIRFQHARQDAPPVFKQLFRLLPAPVTLLALGVGKEDILANGKSADR